MNYLMENINTSNKKYRKVGPYILLKPIGKGAYSTVYQAKKQGETFKYAVKQISLVAVNPKQLQRIQLQIKVLSLIKHHNIVCLVDFKQTSRNLYLIFQYCRHTDLEAHNEKYCLKQLPEEKVQKIAIQIKNAFKVLRANKVVHRDLKLANILVTDDFQIKIADFGFANLLDDDQFFKSYVGTPLTMAPEILQNRSYNEKCDLWSLGIVLYQLLFGNNPFFSKDRMTKGELKNATKAQLKLPKNISKQATDLLKKLIVRQPTQRISFDDFFKHPWLNQDVIKGNLNQQLLQQALRVEIGKSLLSHKKKKQQKDYLLNHSQNLLAYEIMENARNGVESKIMFWINMGKKIISLDYRNKLLSFLALSVLINHIKTSLQRSITITVNQSYKFNFNNYLQLRSHQKWEMNQYTKRLPGFIERSLKKFAEQIKAKQSHLSEIIEQNKDKKLIELYIIELINQASASCRIPEQFEIFEKIKSFNEFTLNTRIMSNIFIQKTINMMLRKVNLNLENNKMLKRLVGIFKIENIYKESPEDKIYQKIKLLKQNN